MGNKVFKKKKEEEAPTYEVLLPRDRRGSIEQDRDFVDDDDLDVANADAEDLYNANPITSSSPKIYKSLIKRVESEPASLKKSKSIKTKESRVPEGFKEYLEDPEGSAWYLDEKGILTRVKDPTKITIDVENPEGKSKQELEDDKAKKDAERARKLRLVNTFLLLKYKTSAKTGQKYIFRESVPWVDPEMLEILKQRMDEESIIFDYYKKRKVSLASSGSSGSTKSSLPPVKQPWIRYVNSKNPHLKTPFEDSISKMTQEKILQMNEFEQKNSLIIQNLCMEYQNQLNNPPKPCKKSKLKFSEFEAQFKKSMFRQEEQQDNNCGCCEPNICSTGTISTCSDDLPCCPSSLVSCEE